MYDDPREQKFNSYFFINFSFKELDENLNETFDSHNFSFRKLKAMMIPKKLHEGFALEKKRFWLAFSGDFNGYNHVADNNAFALVHISV